MPLFPGFYPDDNAYPGIGNTAPAGTIIAVTPEPGATPPRMRLDVTSDQASLVIWRVAQDGTRSKVRTHDGGPLIVSGGSTFLYDPEPPQGELVTYTADQVGEAASGPLSVDSGQVWLVDPAVPARSVPVRVAGLSDRSAASNQSVRYPLGRKFPIVANDGVRKADTYTLRLRTVGQLELDALNALLASLATLLLNVPTSKQWVDLGTEYIACGDLARRNPASFQRFAHREWSLPCSVTDRPAGGSQAFITYGYSKALYPTYGARKAAHATYGQAFDPE